MALKLGIDFMFFEIDRNSRMSFQSQLRTSMVEAIINGQLTCGTKLPSTRKLAKNLGLSRVTVVIVYEKLAEDGYINATERSGYRVADIGPRVTEPAVVGKKSSSLKNPAGDLQNIDWEGRLDMRVSSQRNIVKPVKWQDYPFPFVYGQPDTSLFPLGDWRECSRQAMSQMDMLDWANDAISQDDPYLVQQIKSKLLPTRGIFANDDEILVTMGAQNGLYLAAAALMKAVTRVGIEDPGYPDVRNIFEYHRADLVPLEVDEEGVRVDDTLVSCDVVYVTPSHQYPTTVTLSENRRRNLLEAASKHDFFIIEDDFESETNYTDVPVRALKSQDRDGRVIHVGSLSKSMFPGLRLGYVVAPSPLIKHMRALRRLMLRHAPSNNQRTTSFFIAMGYHLTYTRQLNQVYSERRFIMNEALQRFMPGMSTQPKFGGTSFWVKGPEQLDAEDLAQQALSAGVVLEPGQVYFSDREKGKNYFRLGFSSIATQRIEEGLQIISELLASSKT
ncbi:PLP-dependent aminotransferase family protein [Sneathiella marina]|uniref:PLP-dependent aminotransferase family protein n=1 Tax=Sneathiella marina TaxID=2950108 RepID=A0ABY4W742_9PROT|nr:PLP-dependent aminotransferase family protein [Sneathiella marina]USG63006.1 PLP-dependent aminotransferase family protein [Sneathiella marina]